MKFGVREIANVVFKARDDMRVGKTNFKKGQPVLYIDSAKTSTMEGAATTVYATGGRGNTRLLAWEGEKTLTFTVEDALLSPIGFSILSGAGLFSNSTPEDVNVHMTAFQTLSLPESGSTLELDLSNALATGDTLNPNNVFIAEVDEDDSITGNFATFGATGDKVSVDGQKFINITADTTFKKGTKVFVDFYVKRKVADVTELQIDAEHFGGYFYVEADTLFRKQDTGKDWPAVLTFPKVKIQSNFTFTMASSGDPSTFTFTMDAMPEYTWFDDTKKVLCVMQVTKPVVKTGSSSGGEVMGFTE